MTAFQGFPERATTFYEDLAADNSKAFWTAHRSEYETAVREPMLALGDELSAEFGPFSVFRPYRDTRFSKDKSPYKTHQGAIAGTDDGIGYYVEISAAGLLVGGGYHSHSPAQVQRYREAVDDQVAGAALEAVVAALPAAGLETEGERLKTAPRGYAKDHPRLTLLQYKSLMALRRYGTPEWLATPRALDEVRSTWRAITPLVGWISTHVGPA